METEFLVSEAALYGQDILESQLFSEYVRKCLYRHGCRTVGHIARMTVPELLEIKGIYERQCAEIVEVLAEKGIEIPENRSHESPQAYGSARTLPYPQNLICDILGLNLQEISQEQFDFDHIRGLTVALALLPTREETMILLRYKHLYSLEDVGKYYQITGERARQIIRTALRRLRHPARCRFIQLGLNGYIEFQTKKSIDSLLYDEYMRGYHDGLEDSDNKSNRDRILVQPIENLELSVRSFNCLKRAGLETINDLVKLDKREICRIRNLGLKSTEEIAKKLQEIHVVTPAWKEAISTYVELRKSWVAKATQTDES